MSDQCSVTREVPSLDSCLVGTLSAWPLADLLLWLHQSERTAMLRVGMGLEAGIIFFRHGQVYRCEWGGIKGEQALIGLLGLADGSFTLIQRAIPDVRPNIARSTPELLLQCAVALDEHRQPRKA